MSAVGIACDCGWSSVYQTSVDRPELHVWSNQDFDAHAKSCWRAAKYIEEMNRRYLTLSTERRQVMKCPIHDPRSLHEPTTVSCDIMTMGGDIEHREFPLQCDCEFDPREFYKVDNCQLRKPLEVGAKLWMRKEDSSGVTVLACTVDSVGSSTTMIVVDEDQPQPAAVEGVVS